MTTTPDFPRAQALVLYDGQCRLCLKSVALLRRLDWRGVLDFRDARRTASLPARDPPLDPEQLLEQLHLVAPPDGRVLAGFAAFRWMAWRLPLLWPLAPLLYVPGVPSLGQKLYLWVARNRFRLVPCHGGVCELSRRTDAGRDSGAGR